MSALIPSDGPTIALIAELRQLIADARLRVASAVNAELTGLYWQVGQRIHREVLGSQRAGYGEEIVSTLSRQLSADYGRGFSAKNLRHMMRFAQAFPDEENVSALRRQFLPRGWLRQNAACGAGFWRRIRARTRLPIVSTVPRQSARRRWRVRCPALRCEYDGRYANKAS